eukprot:Skav218798  [mRNA]  locus=scaffold1140:254662:268689:+ [translate_table: standard]
MACEERHVRFITKKLVDNLLSNGQALGKAWKQKKQKPSESLPFLGIGQAFCEIDPERRYAVSKDQFANAIATACRLAMCWKLVENLRTVEDMLGAESAAVLTGGLNSMSVGSQEPRLPPGGRFTVMMFGMTGSGKSALGNLLAGYDHFQSGDDTASVTNTQSVMKYEAPDRSLVVLDTIGLGDTELDQEPLSHFALRSSSAPPNSGDDGASEHGSRQNPLHRAGSDAGSGSRSQISRTGASIAGSAPIYDMQVNQLTGKARISDVIRARFNAWKPDKSQAQLYPVPL